MKTSNFKLNGVRTAAAMILATWLGTAATTATAGPAFYPIPDVSRQATQGFYLVGCGGGDCSGAFFAEDFFDPKGDYQGSFLTVQEFGDRSRAAVCPLNRGELTVRNDAGLATLNATINVADCFYVTQTCDDEGRCAPDYEGTITIVASAQRPMLTANGSNHRTVKGDGYLSTFTCEEKMGQEFAEALVAVNGNAWIADSSQATKRNCNWISRSP